MKLSTKSHTLLTEVARCPNVASCFTHPDHEHPCRRVIAAQQLPRSTYHLPEPWSGRIESAPILFVSSNPSFNPRERFPTESWSDDEIETFFTTRFQHSDQTSHFWRVVRRIAEDILGRAPRSGYDYALTEVVRCKSWKESGVVQALEECEGRYLARTLEVAAATLIVALGKKARSAVATHIGVLGEIGLYGPLAVADRERSILLLGHPSAAERKKPTFDEIRALRVWLGN